VIEADIDSLAAAWHDTIATIMSGPAISAQAPEPALAEA
jgi:hypothetical protein